VLTDSKHLSLEERCYLIKRKWNIQITRPHLSNIYKIYGVKGVKRPSFKFTLGKRTISEHQARIRLYVDELIWVMRKGKKIIYTDETSTHLWERLSRIWMRPEEPVEMRFRTGRGKSITVTGGICQSWATPVFLVSDKTNTESFLNFLKAVEAKIKGLNEAPSEYVVVLDNHSAHHAISVRAYASMIGLKLLYLPPTESQFNPIESKQLILNHQKDYQLFISKINI
jgi:hypothetical protein